MRRTLAGLLLLAGAHAMAQEGQLQSDFRREGEEFKANCSNFKSFFSCAQTLVTGKPLHVAIGTIAPGNGVAFGPAFVYDKNVGDHWRLNFNADAVVSTNQSWRAGAYMKAFYMPKETIGIITQRPKPGEPKPLIKSEPVPEFNLYVQGISLNKLSYYGLGPSSLRSNLTFFGLQETIVGGNTIYPIFGHSGLSLFGELNGRLLSPRARNGEKSPSIEQRFFTEATAPGLLRQRGYFQAGEGVKWNRGLGDRFNVDYSVTLQQYLAVSDSHYSFQRFTIDALHEIPLYRNQRAVVKAQQTGPDESPKPLEEHPFTVNREGSLQLRALLSESFIPSGHAVPYYLQPTIGGGDINANNWVGSYPDYRFRAPNVLLFRAALEHSLYGPLGGLLMADFGRVALTHGDLGFDHFRHSYGVGVTVRAGGLPAVSVVFAFGGHEGTHTIATVSPAFFGGSSRPSLY